MRTKYNRTYFVCFVLASSMIFFTGCQSNQPTRGQNPEAPQKTTPKPPLPPQPEEQCKPACKDRLRNISAGSIKLLWLRIPKNKVASSSGAGVVLLAYQLAKDIEEVTGLAATDYRQESFVRLFESFFDLNGNKYQTIDENKIAERL